MIYTDKKQTIVNAHLAIKELKNSTAKKSKRKIKMINECNNESEESADLTIKLNLNNKLSNNENEEELTIPEEKSKIINLVLKTPKKKKIKNFEKKEKEPIFIYNSAYEEDQDSIDEGKKTLNLSKQIFETKFLKNLKNFYR